MREVRRARAVWLSGAQALHRAELETAVSKFERAIELDSSMADAWLGLHATVRNRDRAVAEMSANEHRFGEERRRANLALVSRFGLGPYITYSLESHAELWCAVAAGHLDRSEYDLAASALSRVPDSNPGWYLRGRMAFRVGEIDDAITWLQRVIRGGDRFLTTSAQLMTGIALAEAGAIELAVANLNQVLCAGFLRNAHPEAHYWLGIVDRARGEETLAMDHFHRAYAQNPHVTGLKAALAEHEPAVRVAVNRGEVPTSVRSTTAGEDEPPEATSEPAETSAQENPDDILAELDAQIGQDAIKRQVRALLAQIRAQTARSEAGLSQTRMTKHFVFTGPPGTGKTTVARIIGRLYAALGVLADGHVVEVDRSALIGEFLGHTAAKTQRKLDEAMGGVLLIDEAYALAMEGLSGGDAYGKEAIDTLLKRMEDDRDRFIVIAAGYPAEMDDFLDSNPGLRSRFTTTVDFAPYSADELGQIADLMATASEDRLTPGARAELADHLSGLEAAGVFSSTAFGNARYVRTLIEGSVEARNLRIFADDSADPSVDEMVEVTRADIVAAVAQQR